MKSIFTPSAMLFLCCAGLVLLAATYAVASDVSEKEPSKAVLESETDRISYAIGLQLGSHLVQNELEISPDAVLAGVEDMLRDREKAMTDEEVGAAMMALQAKMEAEQEKMMREMESQGEGNLEKAEAFLTENAAKEGVIQLASGLQYRVVEPGSGDKAQAESQVRVHYRGTLLDGSQFDSSYDRGEPAVFRVNQVIPGWQEALQLMSVGAKYELFIPPGLAYGERGNQRIPANSLLLFDVELLEIME